ncbi:sucrose phosphorylase [Enterobacter hormaechei]|uniref:sugar phosphorylase n=1 Tax=Enterobacter cloacae complex TaxID=354276 RepID=UPI00063CD0BC|nr:MULTISPECIES: sugar phosphorylase [Enterobacter cloacae complex]AVF15456.1 sucrose phosphorylase [Enterobacter cloacae complex sp.]QLV54669.1 sugar phosphorylase [Enterobacter cloacae]AOP83094.1 sugar phosphorylase [Enterobacter hormaechei subsp. oharae]EHE7792416.1 sugar phosphorylase [Enterobacter hormaechei]ELC6405408.1 sugar phosphorylase [Enterobacter hormaechei]
MENNVNAKIKKLINHIYGESFSDAHLNVLLTKLEKAAVNITEKRKSGWDEKDVVLITYADQFSAKGEKALPVFTRFYNEWLSRTFSHVHLLPFYPWSSDDGFSVIDYHEVAPETGTWRDVAELKQSASLMFDFVCNHMSAKSEWFANYLAQKPGYEDFFISVDPETDLSAVTRPRALPLLTPFTLHDGSVRHLWTTFSDDQIDLNFASPQVLIAMVDVLLHYLMEGARYIRLDAVGFMWKIPGTTCIHLEQTHCLIQLFRAITDAVAPGTVIITETNVPHKDNISYFGDGENEAQMVYQFSLPPLVLHAVHRQDVKALCQWAGSLALPSTHTTWFNFLASHDGIGLNPLRGILPESEILSLVDKLQQEGALVNWKNNPDGTRSPYEINVTYLDALSLRDSSDDERIARFILAHAVLLSFPGVPAVYIQSILGSRNDYEGVERLGYNRAINRKKYTAGQVDLELNNKKSIRYQIYSRLSELIAIRRGERAFHPDSQAIFDAIGEHILKIVRVAENGERMTALFNFSNKMQTVYGQTLFGTELLSGQDISGTELTLNPWQVMWIKEN